VRFDAEGSANLGLVAIGVENERLADILGDHP
jgi:hypothetical protein